MYEFRFDGASKVLHIKMVEFWSIGTIAGFSAAAIAKALALRCQHGRFATLIDLREFPIQSSEVTYAIEALMKKASTISDAPIVTVVGSMLAKHQAGRILKAENSHIFLDWDQANVWLEAAWPTPVTA